jgi:hypothetical protein
MFTLQPAQTAWLYSMICKLGIANSRPHFDNRNVGNDRQAIALTIDLIRLALV